MDRLRQGEFLSVPELSRLADSAQYRVVDLSEEDTGAPGKSKVIDLKRIRMRRKEVLPETKPVDVATQASRLRYMADYLEFLVMYVRWRLSWRYSNDYSKKGERCSPFSFWSGYFLPGTLSACIYESL
jgi:hypothetical protein